MSDELNPTSGPVYDPAGRQNYITTHGNVNIGPPGVFRAEHVMLSDIVRALSMQVRYYGHLDRFYSIAEHSVLVSWFAELRGDTEAIVPGLFHDAHEAYTGDVASPQKDMVAGFRAFERAMEAPVREALGLAQVPMEVWKRVREYDILILHRELPTLRTRVPDWYDPKMEALVPSGVQPVGLDWHRAEAFFWSRMHAVGFRMPGRLDLGASAR